MSVVLRERFSSADRCIIMPAVLMSETEFCEFEKKIKEGKKVVANVFRALVDTGSEFSCITEKAVKKLEIVTRGKTEMISAIGRHQVETCIFHVCLVEQKQLRNQQVQIITSTKYHQTRIDGCILPDKRNFDLVLGMDVIGRSLMIMDGIGHLTMSLD